MIEYVREPYAFDELWGPTRVLTDGRKGIHMPLGSCGGRTVSKLTRARYLVWTMSKSRFEASCEDGSDKTRHGVPVSIISDRDSPYLAILGALAYVLVVSRVSYNHSVHMSIVRQLCEMLYGRKCRTPICWGEVGQRVLGSTEMGVNRFRKRGKLGPRYIGPLTVLARVGKVAYCLELPEVLGQNHDTFHMSQLHKWPAGETTFIPLDDFHLDESLNYVETPVALLEQKVKRIRIKEFGTVKVQWQHRKGSE
ncbi:hypothetical protein OSB04_018882 [Centaurea solstitialis]|uniref:Tf2-1-like SH3-like domain-containing protein n=1 Tax=Centaurea solstitialis TaxID=347529 RepID=A0AA38SQV0_9ASTR|nr:hypothetical protein OSB04_018882 [Centaurea solstitialis]